MFIPVGGWLASCATSMAGYLACHACTCVSRQVLTSSARVAWSALFFVAMVVAWVLRDFAKPLLEKIPCEQRRRAAAGRKHMQLRQTSSSACSRCQCAHEVLWGSLRAGIVRDAAALDLDDKWFGEQAVYRVSLGSFVSCPAGCHHHRMHVGCTQALLTKLQHA